MTKCTQNSKSQTAGLSCSVITSIEVSNIGEKDISLLHYLQGLADLKLRDMNS